jgi:IS5 family transposase
MYADIFAPASAQGCKDQFLKTDVGKLYQAIPFDKLASLVPEPKREQSAKGRKPWLNVSGGIGLLVLKHYLCLSDAMLIERLNTPLVLATVLRP